MPGLDAKLGSPRTTVAFSPLANGDGNPRTLPLPVSETQSIPEWSNAMKSTTLMQLAATSSPKMVQNPPTERVAAWPFENGGVNSEILWSLLSATHRFPE
jgi:hypothetical protein